MPDDKDQRLRDAVGGASQGPAAQPQTDAPQKVSQLLQHGADQMRGAAEASAQLPREMIDRAGQNFEVMRRIGETLSSGAQSATSEVSEYVRHTTQRQQEMVQKLSQARTPSDVLDIQSRYFMDNLRELLGVSEKLLQNSADTARQAGQGLGGGGQSQS
ncbi:MAG TPA: phasin family protein [Roseomonas sp.]|jgi:hypothetical protein